MKKKINEGSIAGFINKFLDGIQQDTQKRFIKNAQKRGVPKEVLSKMSDVERDIIELRNILKEF